MVIMTSTASASFYKFRTYFSNKSFLLSLFPLLTKEETGKNRLKLIQLIECPVS